MVKILDFYFSQKGDILATNTGDIALVESTFRDDSQQAYIRVMTEPGDYLLYPSLGADLASLYGMPQSESTGNVGINIIQAALNREGRFVGRPLNIKAIPTGPQSIRFDVFIVSDSKETMLLQIEQKLGVQ